VREEEISSLTEEFVAAAKQFATTLVAADPNISSSLRAFIGLGRACNFQFDMLN